MQLSIFVIIIYINIINGYEILSSDSGRLIQTCSNLCISFNLNNKSICVKPLNTTFKGKEINNPKMICSRNKGCNSCNHFTYSYPLFKFYCRNNKELNLCNSMIGRDQNKTVVCDILPCEPYSYLNLEYGIKQTKEENNTKHVFLHITWNQTDIKRIDPEPKNRTLDNNPPNIQFIILFSIIICILIVSIITFICIIK